MDYARCRLVEDLGAGGSQLPHLLQATVSVQYQVSMEPQVFVLFQVVEVAVGLDLAPTGLQVAGIFVFTGGAGLALWAVGVGAGLPIDLGAEFGDHMAVADEDLVGVETRWLGQDR